MDQLTIAFILATIETELAVLSLEQHDSTLCEYPKLSSLWSDVVAEFAQFS